MLKSLENNQRIPETSGEDEKKELEETETSEQQETEKSDFTEFDVMDKKKIAEYGYYMEDRLESVRNIKPKLVFLTQTSSIPYGVILKEAYKTRYPDEEAPKFLTIDPKPIRWSNSEDSNTTKEMLLQESINETAEKIKRYKLDDEDTILLMDETEPDLISEESIKEAGKELQEDQTRSIGIATRILRESLKKIDSDAKVEFSYIAISRIREGRRHSNQDPQGVRRSKLRALEGITGWVEHKDDKGVTRARRYKGKAERDISKKNMEYLKKIGRCTKNKYSRKSKDMILL